MSDNISVIDTDMEVMSLHPDDIKEHRASKNICKLVGGYLVKVYPNRNWHIVASARNGYVFIQNKDISMTHGMNVHIPATIPELLEKCKRSAGEILERFELTRSKNTNNLDAVVLPRDVRGNVANSKIGELDKSIKSNVILE